MDDFVLDLAIMSMLREPESLKEEIKRKRWFMRYNSIT